MTKNMMKRLNRREQKTLTERRKLHPSDHSTILSLPFMAKPKSSAKHTSKVAAVYRDVRQITIQTK